MSVGKIPLLTKEQEDAVLKGMNYSRDQLKIDTQLLRNWLNEQEHFPESRKTELDCFLVNFLVGCKGSVEKAKWKLDKYYSIRGHGDLFSDRGNFTYVDRSFEAVCYAPLSTFFDGTQAIIMKVHNFDLGSFCPTIYMKTMILYMEYLLRCGSGINGGLILLHDAAGMTVAHISKINVSLFKPLAAFLQGASPFRMKKNVVFNADPLMDSIVNTFGKPFLSKKLRERVIVTKDCNLGEHVDENILPSCYGGKAPDTLTISRAFQRTLKEGLSPIIADLDAPTDESKRPLLNGFRENPHFGAFGSIKTLVTD